MLSDKSLPSCLKEKRSEVPQLLLLLQLSLLKAEAINRLNLGKGDQSDKLIEGGISWAQIYWSVFFQEIGLYSELTWLLPDVLS